MSDACKSIDLDKLIANGQLPALPQSAINLLQLSKDPNVGPAEFAVPIETDAGLTSQVLRFVNSSYFGFSREISSVKLAITLVGMRTVKNFALWSAVFSLMPNPKCGPFDLKCLWQDSLRRALFAKCIASQLGSKDSEDAFAAALLQDMAVPILAKAYPDEYVLLLEARENGKRRLSDLEQERFGMTHAEAGGRMARHWNLPETFAHLIESHTAIEAFAAGDAQTDELAVALSALLPTGRDDAWTECQMFEGHFEKLVSGKAAVLDILRRTDEEFAEMAPILKIAAPKQTLVERYETACSAAVG